MQAVTSYSDGKFRFPLVPVTTYSISKSVEMSKSLHGTPLFRFVPLSLDGEGGTKTLVVNANKTTTANVVEVQPPSESELIDPNPLTTLGTNRRALPAVGPSVAYKEVTQVVDGKTVKMLVSQIVQHPIASAQEPNYGLPSPPNSAIGLPGPPQLPSEVPASQLTLLADRRATGDETLRRIIETWQASATDSSDQTELRKLLLDHLQQEFDTTQTARIAEIERLQSLLDRSIAWMDMRAKKRDEIIQKRVEELLENSVPTRP